MKITTRALSVDGSRLMVVSGHGVGRVRHVLRFPVGACPVSRNPLSGTITVSYLPSENVVEVVSLHDAVTWGCSAVKGSPSSVEEFASWLRREVSAAVGVPASVVVSVSVLPGPQTLQVVA